jgi:hypothetical protein
VRIIFAGGLLVRENIICWWTIRSLEYNLLVDYLSVRISSGGGILVGENIICCWRTSP